VIGRKAVALTTLLAALSLPSLAAAPAGAGECWSLRQSERALKQETNESRVVNGRIRLPLDQELSKVARRHSEKMAAAGTPFHSDAATISSLVTGRWTALHENVGAAVATGSASDDMARIEKEFMNSTVHRENILRRGSDYLGVGIARAGGRYYVTVLFVDGADPGTSLRIQSC
jgi:uncharacterized protein YkwD